MEEVENPLSLPLKIVGGRACVQSRHILIVLLGLVFEIIGLVEGIRITEG